MRWVAGVIVVASVGCAVAPRATSRIETPPRAAGADVAIVGAPLPDPGMTCALIGLTDHPRFVGHSYEWPNEHQSFDEGFITRVVIDDPTLTFILRIGGHLSPHCELDEPALAFRRAARVARVLIERGVPPERIVIHSWAAAVTAAAAQPDTCRAEDGLLNGWDRRVETSIYLCERSEERAARQQRTRSASR